MVKKYFVNGYIIQTERTISPNETTKMSVIIEMKHPTLNGLFKGKYVTTSLSEMKMFNNIRTRVLCELYEDKDGKLNISNVVI